MTNSLNQSGNIKRDIKEVIIQGLSDVKQLFDQQKKVFYNAIKTQSNVKSYATVTSQSAHQHLPHHNNAHNKAKQKNVIVIKQMAEQKLNPEQLKKKIKQRINPISMKIGIQDVRPISGDGLLIECPNQKECETLKDHINKEFKTLSASVPIKKFPRVIITDIEEDIESDSLIRTIEEQNPKINEILRNKNNSITYKFFIKSRTANRKHVVLEVSPAIYEVLVNEQKVNIGWLRCNVRKFVSVTRCFKCLGFNHTAKNEERCLKRQFCSLCSGEHKHNECQSQANHKTCINCVKFNERLRNPRLKVNTNHGALDPNCPCLQYQLNLIESKTDYGG